MARLIDIHVVCDRCQDEKGPDARVEAGNNVVIGFGANAYELDLCDEHAQSLDEFRAMIEKVGRPTKPGKRTKTDQSSSRGGDDHHYFKDAYGEYPCNDCAYVATTPQGIAAHRRAKHEAVTITCEVCGRECNGNNGYKTHIRTHSDHVRCGECGKEYLNRAGLASHLRMSGHGAAMAQPMIESSVADQ